MRIAYVAHWDVSSETGILKKMAAQIRTWIAEGCTVRYFVVSPGDTVWAGVRDLPIHVTRGKTFWQRVLRMRDLYDAVVSWEPDIVYLRFSTYYPVLEAIVDRYPTVVEINSDDVREYRLMLSSTKYLLHRLSRSRLLRRVRGMVFVTGEIVSRPYFARFDKPALVLGNSISLSDYYVLPAPCNRVPRLVFSGLGKSPWHGLDKVLHLAASCPDFTFDVIGHATDDFGQRIPDNVQVHGVLTRPAYEPILARADVAIGSLAMHRNGMDEGSPLKLREYLAYGIPSIIGYRDTDFPGEYPWLLRLPNTPDNVAISLDYIRRFVTRMRGVRVPREAVEHLDVRRKERKRLDFMEDVLANARR